MPNWKKLITSGSSGSLAQLNVDTSVTASAITSTSGSVDNFTANDKLQLGGAGSQFFAYNEDTIKVKFANWYSSNDRQYGMGQLWYETWFAAIDNQAGRDNRRIGFYLEEPDAGASDADGGTGAHPSNARFYVDINGAYLSGSLQATGGITGSSFTGSFVGDGSQLTGVTAPGTLSGSSQVDITQTTGYSTFSSSIQTYTDAQVASLVDSAPGTLDTLNELAAALNDDPNFSASIATSIGNRVLTSTFNTYSGSAHTQREALKYTDDKVKAKLNADGVVSSSAQLDGFVSQSGNFVANETIIATGTNSVTSSNILALDTVNNYLGINQSNPEVTLHMTGDGAQTAQIRMEQYNDSSDAPDIRTRKARGTSASPAKNNAGDFIYRQNAERYNGSAYTTVGQIAVDSTGSADRFRLTLTVSEDGNTIDAAANQFMIDGNNSGAIKFNDSYYFPTSDGNANEVLTTDGSGTLTFSNPIPSGTISSSAQTVANLSNQDVDFGTGHITAQRLTVTGSITDWVRFHTDRVLIAKDLRHLDDSDTYLRFINDGVQLHAGGEKNFEVSPSTVTVNPAGNDIDFIVESSNNDSMLIVDGGTDRVGIGMDGPTHTLSVAGTVSASAYIGDGSGLTGINASIVSSSTVSDTFTSVTAYTASHALNTKDVIVNVYDDNDRMIIPSEITTLSTTSVGIDFGTAVSGRVVIGKAGHIVSGAADVDLSTISEHVLPSTDNTYDLGSPTKQWRDLYLSSASLYIDGQQVLSSTSDTLTFTTDTGQSIKLLETGADDIILQTDTGNIELKGTVEILSGKKITDSASNVVRFGNSIGITGSIETTGTVDGIDLQAFSSSVATSLANSTADYTELTNVPSDIVSSSAQITTLTSYTETFTSQTAVTASHSLGTKNVTVQVYGSDDFMIFPTSIKTHDTNNVYVQFNSSRSGRIVITK